MIEDPAKEPLIYEDKPNMAIPKRKLTKVIKIVGTICVLAFMIMLVTALATGRRISTIILMQQESSLPVLDNVKYDEQTRTLTFTDHDLSQDFLIVNTNYKLVSSETKVTDCLATDDDSDRTDATTNSKADLSSTCSPQLHLQFENLLLAVIYETDLDGMKCHSVQWRSYNTSSEITNCISINDNWYGGGGLSIQRWPLNRVNVPLQPHVTQKYKRGNSDQNHEARFDAFIEPYFVSAKGAAVMFEHFLPLFISMNHENDKKLCFTSAFKKPYAAMNSEDKLILKYLVCKDRTAKSVHRHMLKTSQIPFFHGSPQIEILQNPIWSTRGLDWADIDEAKVLSLIKNIKSNKLNYGHLFIDGNYSRSRGNFYFSETKFPHSHQLIMELNSPGEVKLPVGVEVCPFIPNEESTLFAIQYKNNAGLKPGQDPARFLDVSNEAALKWYKSQLRDLNEQINVRGLRFSGGYAMDIVNGADQSVLLTNKTIYNLNIFTYKYAEVANEIKATILLGSGYNSQIYTFVADAGPLQSSWEHDKGLKSIIPTVLTYGIMGYPFALMGPIGGMNLAAGALSGLKEPPNKELYIRWLQLATYLPVMELSVGPWVYGQDVVNYTQSLLSFRYNNLWPKLLSSAVEEAVKLGIPIARPLWWISPEDKVAQFIDCEFFLGYSLLVAPVLNANARERDIYLPEGSWWKDQLRGERYKGGQWLRRFKVGLFEIATFKRDIDPNI